MCACMVCACASYPAAPHVGRGGGGNAVIHFVNFGNVYDWEADGNRGIYVQTLSKHWYYARLFAPCLNLPFADRVGFVVEPASGSFDKFSSIVVQGETCPVRSLRKSGPPPSRSKSWRHRPHKHHTAQPS